MPDAALSTSVTDEGKSWQHTPKGHRVIVFNVQVKRWRLREVQ